MYPQQQQPYFNGLVPVAGAGGYGGVPAPGYYGQNWNHNFPNANNPPQVMYPQYVQQQNFAFDVNPYPQNQNLYYAERAPIF